MLKCMLKCIFKIHVKTHLNAFPILRDLTRNDTISILKWKKCKYRKFSLAGECANIGCKQVIRLANVCA